MSALKLAARNHYSVQTQQRGDEWGFTFEIENDESRWCSDWVKVDATTQEEASAEAARQGRAMIRALRGQEEEA